METLYHLLGLVIGHAVDPDRVDPRSGEVLSTEDGQSGLVRHQDRLLIEPENIITQNFSFLSLDVGDTSVLSNTFIQILLEKNKQM